jgi:hypothetical protein
MMATVARTVIRRVIIPPTQKPPPLQTDGT